MQLNSAAQTVFACVEIVYKVGLFSYFDAGDMMSWSSQHFEAQEESHGAMTSLAESIRVLADQLNRLEEVPQSDQLHHTIQEFSVMMEQVVDFIQKWLEHWTRMYNLSEMALPLNHSSQSSISSLRLKRQKWSNYKTNLIASGKDWW